ncbi:MAG TPA: hypothetical protein VMZ03_07590 [Chitinophagaceae bacterium]|nr:hypothetical protein [Chitinophagaceae bacterium]
MKFGIVIKHEGRNIRLQVQRISITSQLEKFQVIARNRSLTIQSNRPLLRAKGMKTRKPDYKLVAGIMHNLFLVQQIIDVLHYKLKDLENPSVSPAEWLRRKQ